MTADANLGSVPVGNPHICAYRSRIVFAGEMAYEWWMSRQDTPTDWYYDADINDPGRAVAGENSDAGKIGDHITAVIPGGDDYLVFGCKQSTWALIGDPCYGAQLHCLSRAIGPVNGFSWAHGPDNEIIMLTPDGLYGIPAGMPLPPQAMSRKVLPSELLNVNPKTKLISMAYDPYRRGINIFVTTGIYGSPSTDVHYYFDWDDKTFWPEQFAVLSPSFALNYKADDPANSCLLAGCTNGYIYKFSDSSAFDGTSTLITSYVWIGPIPMNEGFGDGQILDMIGILALGSGPSAWSIHKASTYEAALSAAPHSSGTWYEGRNLRVSPRARGGAFYIRIVNNTTAWALEEIIARIIAFPNLQRD